MSSGKELGLTLARSRVPAPPWMTRTGLAVLDERRRKDELGFFFALDREMEGDVEGWWE